MKTEAMAGAGAESKQLETLYLRHAPSALTTAYLILGDRALAEDMVQEAFLRLVGRFRHLRSPDAFDAYLRKTVVHLCLNHLRRKRVERAYLEREGRRPEGTGGLPDVGLRDELWRAVMALPARRRAAIVLRYYEDLSEQRVADVMGCSVAAARSLVHRGMETLRQQLIPGGEP